MPFAFVAPTVMTEGEFPGETMPPTTGVPSGVLPKLPAAVTTTMPDVHGAFDGLAERVVHPGLGHGVTEREVDDANRVMLAVRDGPVDRRR